MLNRRGFTLLELMIVVIILAILVAVALPMYTKAVERSKQTEAISNLGMIRNSEIRYYTQYARVTPSLGDLDVGNPDIYQPAVGVKRFAGYRITGSAINNMVYDCQRNVNVDYNTAFGLPAGGYTVSMNADGSISVSGF